MKPKEDSIIIINLESDYPDVANIRLMFPEDVPTELAEGTLTIFHCRMKDFIRTNGYVTSVDFQLSLRQELRELNVLLKTWRLGEMGNHHSLYCLARPEDYSFMHSFMYRLVY